MILNGSYTEKYGGDFALDPAFFTGSNFYFEHLKKYLLFDTGRSAILNILKNISCKKALVPNYICKSIIDAFLLQNITIDFYKIDENLDIDTESLEKKIDSEVDIIFFINYFGKIQPQNILSKVRQLSYNNNITIIEDTTHSIFTKTRTIGDYCIASLRKWFSLPDGAIAYSDTNKLVDYSKCTNNTFVKLRKKAMNLKYDSRLCGVEDESYLEYFEKAEQFIDNQNCIYKISDFSLNILKTYNYETMIQQRKENFLYLEQYLKNKEITKLLKSNSTLVPLFYPIYIKERDYFKQYLYRHNIFCPIHWPHIEIGNLWEHQKNIISLVIDQRYSHKDMEKIVDIINAYKGKD